MYRAGSRFVITCCGNAAPCRWGAGDRQVGSPFAARYLGPGFHSLSEDEGVRRQRCILLSGRSRWRNFVQKQGHRIKLSVVLAQPSPSQHPVSGRKPPHPSLYAHPGPEPREGRRPSTPKYPQRATETPDVLLRKLRHVRGRMGNPRVGERPIRLGHRTAGSRRVASALGGGGVLVLGGLGSGSWMGVALLGWTGL